MNRNPFFGTSFSPEYVTWVARNTNVPALVVLKTIRENLNLSDIRLGIRWNRTVNENDPRKISLDFYRPYLDYLFSNKCTVTLNVGPIKVFRWPEEHIPLSLERFIKPTIFPRDELAISSYEYLHKILSLLKREYGISLKNVTFQLDNEPYYRFGKYKIFLSESHVIQTVRILRQYFPTQYILFDSASKRNFRQMVALFQSLMKSELSRGDNLILGLNYYYRIPRRIRFLEKLDPLIFASPFSMGVSSLHQWQKKLGFKLEVSEAQFEPWGRAKEPGNSIEEFEYLIRGSSRYFPRAYRGKLIRLWGTERLAHALLSGTATHVQKQLTTIISKK